MNEGDEFGDLEALLFELAFKGLFDRETAWIVIDDGEQDEGGDGVELFV